MKKIINVDEFKGLKAEQAYRLRNRMCLTALILRGLFLFLFVIVCCSAFVLLSTALLNKLDLWKEYKVQKTVQKASMQKKPILYVLAISPYILLNSPDGIRLTLTDETLHKHDVIFSNGEEIARFLEDISSQFLILNYTEEHK